VHIQKIYELAPLMYCKCLASETLSFIKKIAKLAIKNEKPKVNPLATLNPLFKSLNFFLKQKIKKIY